MNYDPYQSPSAPNPQAYGSAGQLSPQAANELLGTQGWVRFVAVMVFILSALMLLSSISAWLSVSELRSRYDSSAGFEGGYMAGQLLGTALLAFLSIYPGVLLSRYASAIKRFRLSRAGADLEAALRFQRRLWRFVGIIIIVIISFVVLAILLGVMGAIVSSRRL